ncbi:MAG: DUF4301 family protein [Bacteroidales bacterium]|nr:DUF4301 family protein [Bacteroidales bacterium]
MRHISITGDLGSGKSSVARIICERQPYEYFSTGALQRKLAAEKGMNTLDMNKMSESSIDVDKYIDDYLRNIEADKSGSKTYILDSRLAWHFVPSSFKVYLTVRPEIAAERVMNDHKRTGEPTTASLQETIDSLRERQQSEIRRYRKFYDIDYRELSNYDLVVDSSCLTPGQVADRILKAATWFTQADLDQIRAKGMTTAQVLDQLECFEKGFPWLDIAASAGTADGSIMTFTPKEEEALLQQWDNYLQHSGRKVLKFVPASGAASRMFKDLFAWLDSDHEAPESNFEKIFAAHCRCFAFSPELDAVCRRNEGKSLDDLAKEGAYRTIVRNLLLSEGLNYGALPKGLLRFHRYDDGNRKAIAEHMVEGALYTQDKDRQVHLHFTVSPEHRALFEQETAAVQPLIEKKYGVRLHIGFSEQKSSTDTIAADEQNQPFRDGGKLLFRPGGHGALIENLNDLDADIVFVKNIDNVVPDRIKGPTVHYKKLLAGLLVSLQQQAFEYLALLDSGKYSHAQLIEMVQFLQQKLCTRRPDLKLMEDSELALYVKSKLNRPMRVCGMVRNEGEPGGGPFLVRQGDGCVSLQILESSQIDKNDPAKAAMFKNGTHFNPVDLVCSLKDYKGCKFDLPAYVDRNTGFISSKSKSGRELKALELPGLWNGAMSDWNTVFVEVPIETFNPVKTVNDLLREQHQ